MLIALAGSQGSGKSTVLSTLKERGYKVIERKTSRSILDEWGVTLSEVNNDRELTVKFQAEISMRKAQDEREAAESSSIWFTERTHTDLFVYSLIAIGKDNEYDEWLNGYYDQCKMNNSYYAHVAYLKGGMFSVQNDGVRAVNYHYSKMVDSVMAEYNEVMLDQNKYSVIRIADNNSRANYMEELARRLRD